MKGIIKTKPYGRTLYDKVLIEDIIGTYIPIADLLAPGEKMSRNVLEKFRVIKIGGLKLINAQDGSQASGLITRVYIGLSPQARCGLSILT